MELLPVKPAKTYEVIAEQLRTAILDGRFAPGQKLPSVRELSDHLSVSQAAVREALTVLKGMNLVTMRQGEGTFVNRFDPSEIAHSLQSTGLMSHDDVQALLELRKIVEAGAAKLSAIRRSDEQVRALQACIDRMQDDLARATLGEESDWTFHYLIAESSGNPFLPALFDVIAEKTQSAQRASRLALYQIPGEPETLLNQHQAIFGAIERQDPVSAEEAVLAHLRHVEQALGFGAMGST